MSYQVIARKWRPQKFSDLVGQEYVTKTLANAIKNDRVAHAYIFSGARGVGKTTAARILAKALNCVHGPTATPCGECDSCREIAAGTSLDVIEIDAASNRGIDQIRELREMVRYAPASSRSKVVILDEAHMLTGEASNALLKTLEEPPDRVTFVMATTQPEDLVDTIRSRSQHFHFRALTFGEITARLEEIAQKENLKIDAGALAVISRMAEGSMRDALSLLEQARAYCGEAITNDEVRALLGVVPDDALATLVSAIAEGSADQALGLIHTFQKEGRNLQHFCREAIRHMRNLLIAKVCGANSDLIAATTDQRPALAEAAALFNEEDLTRFFQILLQTDDDLRRKPDPRVHLEMGLLRLINAARLAPLEELLTEIKTGTGGSTIGSGSPIPARRAASASASGPGASATSSVKTMPAIPGATSSGAPSSPASYQAAENERVGAARNSAAMNASAAIGAHDSSTSATAPSSSTDLTAPAAVSVAANTAAELLRSNGTLSAEAHDLNSVHNTNGGVADTANENGLRYEGITAEQVSQIKTAVQQQQKFLGELLEHAIVWELSGPELKLYFPAEKKSFAEMLEGRDSLEKLRGISSNVLRRAIRVCAKLAASTSPQPSTHAGSEQQELRAKFERDPMVRSILQRFGGKISEVRRAQEE
jgi:DNA polymerase-3 subunit gamma/tau